MRYCFHVKVFLGDENNMESTKIHTTQNTDLNSTQNIYEKIDEQL